MSYLRRFPPQGGRSGQLLQAHAAELPADWAGLAALLWANGITAIADLRDGPDADLKARAEDAGVAYGHIRTEERRQRLRNAEARYRTLTITEEGDSIDVGIPVRILKKEERAEP